MRISLSVQSRMDAIVYGLKGKEGFMTNAVLYQCHINRLCLKYCSSFVAKQKRNCHDIHLTGISLTTIQEKSLVGNQTGAAAGGSLGVE